ncbi:MAG: hypothetical protein RQ856_00390 [Candidatus Izemoplasmatales bacterium]|nr:hypothetical protein [Candidatus Izemoplasmatales bacterium]
MYFLAFDFGILLSLNLIFYIILGIAVLSGFLKGFKKSFFTFITMAIFYIAFFLTLNMAVNILWNANFSFLGNILGNNLDPSLANFTTFAAGYENILQVLVGEEVDLSQMSGEFLELAMGIMLFALKIVWTILYFTVILIVYKIICFIIRIIFFKTKPAANKMRGFGALVGAANGFMAIFITLIVMGGMISVVDSMSVLIAEANLSQDTQNLTFVPRDNIYQANYSVLSNVDPLPTEPNLDEAITVMEQMVTEYNNNIFVMLANKIEVPSVIDEDVLVPMHINLFDSVLSFDYNENTIAFRYELMVLSEAFVIFSQSEFQETNELTDLTGDEIRDIFQVISNSKLVLSAVPLAIEYAAQRYEQELPINVETLYDGSIDFEEELATMGRIGGALFDILNGAGFIGGEGSLEQIEVTGETVRDLFTDISGSDIILLITETLLLPMLENPEGENALVITVPDDLDLETEFLALGEIFAEIIEADISFEDLMNDDITVTLAAVSNIDLTILLDSQLVTEALISILSDTSETAALSMFTIPANVVWRDEGVIEGELRRILEAFNTLLDISDTLDFENLDISFITDMEIAQITTFFDSYVIRATISDLFIEMDFGDMPLVFPDIIYDENGYFTKDELVATISSVKLIIDTSGIEPTFDPIKVLELTETDIDTFFTSNIIYATVGNYFNTLTTGDFIIPNSVNTTILVDGLLENVITKTELKHMFKALNVLQLTDFTGVGFDATFIDRLENSTLDDVDPAKVTTLLDSEIIHATISDVILGLDTSKGGVLNVPASDDLSNPIVTTISSIDYIDKTEIYDVFRALYHLNITDFNLVNLDDTSLLKDNFTVLMNSAIIHATVSDKIINIGPTVTVPEKDVDNIDILTVVGTTTYIEKTELQALVDGLDLLGVTDPNTFTSFNFTSLNDDAKRTQLLESAILHATISDQLLSLASSLLFIPEQDEAGNDLIVETGTVVVEYVVKAEIKAILATMIAMGYTDVNDLNLEINPQTFIDNMDLALESASMQATVSNMILTSATTSLVIPDQDLSSQDIRIVYTDVTYIEKTELKNFFISIDLFAIPNLSFDTFSIGPTEIQAVDKNIFFNSFIMQATVSDYFLDVAGDETALPGTTGLLVPTTERTAITVNSLSSNVINKTELINMLDGFSTLGLVDYNDAFNSNIITNLTSVQIDQILLSNSLHVTIDNMLRGNASISGSIPALAEDTTTYTVTVTIKSAVKNFILATQQFTGADFTNVSFNVTTVTALTPAQRDIVLDSMIVRNILTDELETMMLADPDPYWPANSDYMNSDPLTFLTEVGINNVFSNYGM